MTTATIDLNRISFFRPVDGKTLREQLQGKKLAGQETVDYMRSLGETASSFTAPEHWGRRPHEESSSWIFAFSLTYIKGHESGAEAQGFCWSGDHVSNHRRFFTGDILDVVVGKGWNKCDLILIED